jgi:hypothetical protein
MAHFRAFRARRLCVAMVTTSHNDNGWNRRQNGANRPLTFGPDEMTRPKENALNADFRHDAPWAKA